MEHADKGNLEDCLSFATKEEEAALDQWAPARGYYRRQWPMLLAFIVVLPAILYGCAWRFSAICRWTLRGFHPSFHLGRALNRSLVVLAFGWALFCLYVVPVEATRELAIHNKESRAYCIDHYVPETSAAGKDDSLTTCLEEATGHLKLGLNSGFADFATLGMLWENGDWGSFSGYYRHLSWLLIPIVAIPPLLTYALVGFIGVVALWVWRGFGRPPSAKTAIILDRTPK